MTNNLIQIHMKNKLKIFTILVIAIFLLTNCKKDPTMPELSTGVLPLILKDNTKDLVIFDNNIAGFAGSVTCDKYYSTDNPKSMNLMVSMNDDPDITAAAISNITSWPVTYNFTASALVALLPGLNNISEIHTNDYFRIFADITLQDGTVLKGNDTLYAGYSSGTFNLPGSSPYVTYPVVCGYEPALAVGSYHSKSPASDWNSEGDITITVDATDNTKVYVVGLEEMEGLVEDVGPLVMHIDPLTFAVTADKSVLVSDVSDWGPYTNLAYQGTGTYNSCNGTYTMKFKITVDQGTFINGASFTFTRN
jgi:hypothetical protein